MARYASSGEAASASWGGLRTAHGEGDGIPVQWHSLSHYQSFSSSNAIVQPRPPCGKVRSYGLRRAASPAGLHTSHTSSRSYFSSRREASGDVESPGSERRPFTMLQSSCQGGLGRSRSRVGSRVCYRRCTLSRFTGGVIWPRTVRRGRLLGTPTPRPSSTGLCRSRVGGVSLGRWFVAHAPATLTAVSLRPASGWHVRLAAPSRRIVEGALPPDGFSSLPAAPYPSHRGTDGRHHPRPGRLLLGAPPMHSGGSVAGVDGVCLV